MQIFGQNISTLLKYHYKYVKFSILTYIVSKKVVELTGDVPNTPNKSLSIMESIITET